MEKNLAESVRWYQKAAAQGDSRADNALGVLYENGDGVEQSDEKAFQCYRRSAERGNGDGMANLAWAYEFGVGTRPQPEKAADLYRRALERNENIPVYGYLGELYALGMGSGSGSLPGPGSLPNGGRAGRLPGLPESGTSLPAGRRGEEKPWESPEAV